MKLICENSNSSHINANEVRGDAADAIGLLDTLLLVCTLEKKKERKKKKNLKKIREIWLFDK